MKAAALVAPIGVAWADALHRALIADGWHVARLEDYFGVGIIVASRRILAVVVDASVLDGGSEKHRAVFARASPGTHIFVVDSELGTPEDIAKNLVAALRVTSETSTLPM